MAGEIGILAAVIKKALGISTDAPNASGSVHAKLAALDTLVGPFFHGSHVVDGDFNPLTGTTLTKALYRWGDVTIPVGVTVTTSSPGTLIFARNVTINGLLTASGKGAPGGVLATSGPGAGGGNALTGFGGAGGGGGGGYAGSDTVSGGLGGATRRYSGGIGGGGGYDDGTPGSPTTQVGHIVLLSDSLFDVAGAGGGSGGGEFGSGGSGGGAIILICESLSGSGAIRADGIAGSNTNGYGDGAGGGGGGGLVIISATTDTLATVSTNGGAGGVANGTNAGSGGAGGYGTILRVIR